MGRGKGGREGKDAKNIIVYTCMAQMVKVPSFLCNPAWGACLLPGGMEGCAGS